MDVTFTRIDNHTHRLTITRTDGSHESVECETRSLLLHDLVHFAVEAEAGISGGFYGLLAQGVPLARLNDRENPPPGEMLMAVERVVGPMQSVINQRMPAHLMAAAGAELAGQPIDAAFVARVQARMRRLQGHWRGTPFGAQMRLIWPPAA